MALADSALVGSEMGQSAYPDATQRSTLTWKQAAQIVTLTVLSVVDLGN